jgi:hypothetical protein
MGLMAMMFDDSETVLLEMRILNAAMIPQSILPPPLAARVRDELSDLKCFQSQCAATGHSRPALRRRLTSACRLHLFARYALPVDPVVGSGTFECLVSSGLFLQSERANLRDTPEKFRHRTAVLILL